MSNYPSEWTSFTASPSRGTPSLTLNLPLYSPKKSSQGHNLTIVEFMFVYMWNTFFYLCQWIFLQLRLSHPNCHIYPLNDDIGEFAPSPALVIIITIFTKPFIIMIMKIIIMILMILLPVEWWHRWVCSTPSRPRSWPCSAAEHFLQARSENICTMTKLPMTMTMIMTMLLTKLLMMMTIMTKLRTMLVFRNENVSENINDCDDLHLHW